jgi:hypothetical protein
MRRKGRHLTVEERQEIVQLSTREKPLAIAEALGIPHRTVKRWCQEKKSDPQSLERTRLKGELRPAFVEVARLFCGPALQCHRLAARLCTTPGSDDEKKPPRPQDEPECFKRTLQREMKRCGASTNFQRRWEQGTFAAHAIPIQWYAHDSKQAFAKRVTPAQKEVTGWLLLVADRGNNDWGAIAVFRGDEPVKILAEHIIAEYLNSLPEGTVKELCLVTGEDGQPTAVSDAASVRVRLPDGIKVIAEKPTKSIRPLVVKASLPSPQALENYLVIGMEGRWQSYVESDPRTPNIKKGQRQQKGSESEPWRLHYTRITNAEYVAELLGYYYYLFSHSQK